MIGNDLVYFPLYSNKQYSSNRSFLNKVFDLSEQLIIQNSANPEKTLWILWSIKEASYKAQFQKNNIRKIIPKKLIIQSIETTEKGFVSIIKTPEGILFGKSIVKKNYVHSVVSNDKVKNNIIKKTKIDSVYSLEQIKDEINNSLPTNASLIKKNQLPYIQINQQMIRASVSHDGPYFAIVY
jgi:phosphopantetheinyl transferase (holo-ACP synthase)